MLKAQPVNLGPTFLGNKKQARPTAFNKFKKMFEKVLKRKNIDKWSITDKKADKNAI